MREIDGSVHLRLLVGFVFVSSVLVLVRIRAYIAQQAVQSGKDR